MTPADKKFPNLKQPGLPGEALSKGKKERKGRRKEKKTSQSISKVKLKNSQSEKSFGGYFEK